MAKAEHITKISTRRALGALSPLLLISVFIASAVISVANDMYAFVKPDSETNIIIDRELSPKELSSLLREKKIIKNDLVFTLYLRSKKKTDLIPSLRGEFTLNSSMSYREILQILF